MSNNNMKIRPLILGAFLLTIATVTVAQQRGPRGGFPPRGQAGQRGPFGQRGQRGPDFIGATRDALNLTPEQVDRLRTMLDARVQSDQAAQDTIQSKIDALATVQEKSPSNKSAIDAAAQALRDAEQEPQRINDKFRSEFMSLLNADQKKKLDAIDQQAGAIDALSRLGVIGNGPGGPGGRGGRGGRGLQPPPPPPPPPPPGDSAKITRGKELFFDKKLSADGSTSCASCHDPQRAFSDGRAVAMGVHKAQGTRNSPALVQAAFGRSFFWDGRAVTLEKQVLQPIMNPKELGLTEIELQKKTGMSSADVATSLASYVRTIRSTDSRFDRFQGGDQNALTPLERAGFDVFRGRGQCIGCHGGPNLTDDRFHNTGVAWQSGKFSDEGRYSVTLNERDHGAFKTPTLREIARTAPYMHDGSLATLEDVVGFYAKGGHRNPYLDPRVRPLGLSSGEQKALVAFLKALSGDVKDGL